VVCATTNKNTNVSAENGGMKMGFGIKLGTGRTYCRFCRQHLEKGQPAIYYSGHNSSGQVHALAEHCPYLTERLLEMEVIK